MASSTTRGRKGSLDPRRVGRIALGLGAGLATASSLACPRLDGFTCREDAQCFLEGRAGVCVPAQSRCAYEDARCDSGYRFPPQTDMGLAGRCVEPLDDDPDGESELSGESEPSGGGEPSGGSSDSRGPDDECELAPASPIAVSSESYAGPIERLTIEAIGVNGIRVEAVTDAVIRDVRIEFGEVAGIVIDRSPGATIERVELVDVGNPGMREAGMEEYGIRVIDSPGVTIRDVVVEQPLTGILAVSSDDLVIEDFRVTDVRGIPLDLGGDCVLVQRSTNVQIRRFFCPNAIDPNYPELPDTRNRAHAGIFIDGCTDAVVSDGLVTNVQHNSGAGVRVHTWTGGSAVEVSRVDVVGGRRSCFSVVDGNDVTFQACRCRSVEDHAWHVREPTGPIRVLDGEYYQVPGDLARCLDGEDMTCDPSVFEQFDVELGQFSPQEPPVVAAPCER